MGKRIAIGGILLVLAGLASLLAYMLSLPVEQQLVLKQEGGPIENASALGYLITAAFLAVFGGRGFLRSHFPVVVVLLAMAARELDFDKRFTTLGILKSRFYFDPSVPWGERLVGLLVVGLILYCVWRVFRTGLAVWRDPENNGRYAVLVTLFAAGFVVFTKSIDGIGRKLAPLGIEVSGYTEHVSAVLEETLELGIPALLGVAAICYVIGKR